MHILAFTLVLSVVTATQVSSTQELPAQGPPEQGPVVCEDKHSACPQWKKDCGWNNFIKMWCPVTCGMCGPPQPPTIPPHPPTPPPMPTNGPVGSCGQPEVQMSRVIDGIDAKKGSWPWQILLLYNGGPGCGGSIIDNK